MKDTKLKLLSELMKNSKKSDRELAKTLRLSQPTITRMRRKLEEEGYIKEYTIIPDFNKLGFEIMALTFLNFQIGTTAEKIEETKKAIREYEKKFPAAVLMGVGGMGLKYERLVISFHKNYTSFKEHVTRVKQLPNVDIDRVESFLVDLTGNHYQPLTFSTIAKYLSTLKENEE